MSKRLRRTLAAVATLGVISAIALPSGAAPTAAATCAAASQKATKLAAAHKPRQAREQAQLCVAATCSAAVRAACRKRVADLTAAIPTIVFAAKDGAGHDLTDVKVSMDGELLVDHIDGTALAVDAGQHTFTFEAAGQPSVDQSFLIVDKQKDRREVVTLAAPPPPPAAEVAVAPPSPPGDVAGSGASRPLRTVGLVVGAAGVVGLVVGGVTGGLAVSKWNASQSECGSSAQCPQHAKSVSDHDAASSLAAVSTIGFVAGGVAVAAGVTLFLLSPRRAEGAATDGVSLRVDPMLGPSSGGAVLKGVF